MGSRSLNVVDVVREVVVRTVAQVRITVGHRMHQTDGF